MLFMHEPIRQLENFVSDHDTFPQQTSPYWYESQKPGYTQKSESYLHLLYYTPAKYHQKYSCKLYVLKLALDRFSKDDTKLYYGDHW